MKVEEILVYQELAKLIPEFKPLVQEVINSLKSYEDEYRQLSDFIIQEHVHTKTELFSGFLANDFTREESMTLTLDASSELKKLKDKLSNINK